MTERPENHAKAYFLSRSYVLGNRVSLFVGFFTGSSSPFLRWYPLGTTKMVSC